MHILLATDAAWIVDEIVAALGDDDVHFTVCREGRAVVGEVKKQTPDLAILDLQIGSMGGMAVTMALRLDESSGAVEHDAQDQMDLLLHVNAERVLSDEDPLPVPPLSTSLMGRFNLGAKYTSDYNTGATPNPLTEQKAYTLIDAWVHGDDGAASSEATSSATP